MSYAEESFKLTIEKGISFIIDDEFKQFMHEEFYKIMFPYIPYDTGELSSTTNETYGSLTDEQSMSIGLLSGNIDETGITFDAPYAARDYYESRNWRREKHPLATENWGEEAFNAHEQELINTLQEYTDRRVIEI